MLATGCLSTAQGALYLLPTLYHGVFHIMATLGFLTVCWLVVLITKTKISSYLHVYATNFKVIGLLKKNFLSFIVLYYFMPENSACLLFQNLAFDNNMFDFNKMNLMLFQNSRFSAHIPLSSE